MDRVQAHLFGVFPRAVGVTTPDDDRTELRQFMVHSSGEFDGVIEQVNGKRSVYSTISSFAPVIDDREFAGCQVIVDKVPFDFDSPAKLPNAAEDNWDIDGLREASTSEVLAAMESDRSVAERVLGDVCVDARRLAESAESAGVPALGIVSGTGLHVHLLYQSTCSRPGDKIGSTARKWIADLNLGTADDAIVGDEQRILRIPNFERAEDGEATGVWHIPVSHDELLDIEPEWITERWGGPRLIKLHESGERPQLKIEEEYVGPQFEGGLGQEQMRPIPDTINASEYSEMMVKEFCPMPCVYERALGRNPPNDVRVKVGIMLLNGGLGVSEVVDIIAGLNWADFDRSTTRYQVKRLADSGRGDWSCRTMIGKGLCTRADDKIECPTYGYQGGNRPA